MRIIDCEQGSPQWVRARLGIPTASCFDKIITPAEGKLSSQSAGYLHTLVAEWFLGEPMDADATDFMRRGTELEPQAAAWYEFEHDAKLTTVGLCLTDDGRVGASPDRLADHDGTVEFKCPAANTHVGYVLVGPPTKYRCQMQGQLWVCEREWCDFVSWNPYIPPVRYRVYRDDEFIGNMAAAVMEFCDKLDEAKATLADAKALYESEREDNEIPAELVT